MTVEATSAAGAVVPFNATATDETSPANPAVTCLPASGSTFALGTTTVNCSATDDHGNTGTNSFTITVQDTTPPTITLPAALSVPQMLPGGAVVTYGGASATDGVGPGDPALTIILNGIAGDLFSFGLSSRTQNIPSDGTYKVEVMFYNNNNNLLYSKLLSFNTGTHGFQMANTSFTLPVNYSKIVYQITLQESAGTAWFDDAFLYLIP